MKTKSLLLYGYILTIGSVFGQTQSNVFTPRGSSVTAYIAPEDNASTRAYYDSYFSAAGRNYLYYFGSGQASSSGQFNCHGYAWNMVEGGPVRWIGYYQQTEEDVYMTDGSYIRVCSETYPGKVSWGSGDHTAITTATPGRWTSKWNRYPLVNHAWNDTPYGTNDLRYYVATAMSGPTTICSANTDATFSVAAGANYSWSFGGALQQISGSNNQNTFTVRNNGSGASGWVTVSITSPCDGRTIQITKNLTLGAPQINGILVNNQYFSNGYVCKYSNQYIQVTPNNNSNSYNWYISSGNAGNASLSFSGGNATFQAYQNQCFGISVTAQNSCGSAQSGLTMCGQDCYARYTVYPNPAKDYVTVEFDKVEAEALPDEVDLYRESSTEPVMRADVQDAFKNKKLSNGNSIVFDVKQLPRGTYYLHIKNSRNPEMPIEKIRVSLE